MDEDSSVSGFDIKKYLGLVLRKKSLALSIALAVLTLCTLAGFMMPKVYETKCTVFVQHNTLIDPLLNRNVTSDTEAQLRTLTERIKSPSFLERVLRKMGIADNAENNQKLQGLVWELQKNVTVTLKGGERRSDLFVIGYIGKKPTRVRDTVNTIVSEYIAEDLEARKSSAAGASELIQKQLAEYKSKIAATDAAIAAAGVRSRTVTPATTGPSHAYNLNALNSRLATLKSQYTENHPEVVKTKNEIENLKKERPRRGVSSGHSVTPQADLSRLQSERDSYQRAYTDLQQKLDNSRLLQEEKYSGTLKVIDPAPLPTWPMKPVRSLFILAGIALGIAAGIGTVIALDFFNASFKDEESIEAALRLPVLASIPSVVTKNDILAANRHDKKVFIAATAYFSIFLILLIKEFLGFKLGGF